MPQGIMPKGRIWRSIIPDLLAFGQNTPPSIKTFRDGSLDAAGCLDFGGGSDAEQSAAAGQGPVSRRPLPPPPPPAPPVVKGRNTPPRPRIRTLASARRHRGQREPCARSRRVGRHGGLQVIQNKHTLP
jgi:hypothetical protein